MDQKADLSVSVDELSFYIKRLLESSSVLNNIAVRGEISDFKRHSSGHCYFSMTGKETRISCVLFRSDTVGILKWPKPGDEVLVRGRISSYPARGTYQLYCRKIIPIGAGAAARAKKELELRLSKEGLFSPENKRDLPLYPQRIVCITSPTGAAIRDVVKVTGSRYPLARITVISALVQGLGAVDSIVKAFSKVHLFNDPDTTLLLVRGGGSRDDLNTFDDEQVVRAIRSCSIPVVVGVGHQIDKTLSDMAADVTAVTPSEAAELAVPDRLNLIKLLDRDLLSFHRSILFILEEKERELDKFNLSLFEILQRELKDWNRILDEKLTLLRGNMTLKLSEEKNRFSGLVASLEAMSPLAVLKRGFITCSRSDRGVPVTSARSISEGDTVCLSFKDGVSTAEILSVEIREGVD